MLDVVLLTLAIAGAPQAAVVDLSARRAPALAEALRSLPALRGHVLSASQTDSIVADAAGLGLLCSSVDDACLQKLVVLARVDELIALDASAYEVKLTHVSARGVRRAAVRVAGSDATRALVAWRALRRAQDARRVRDLPADDPVASEPDEEPPAEESIAEAPPRRRAHEVDDAERETPTASSGGVTAPLVVGMTGAGAALVLGACTVGVSAALAQQLRATQRGIPLDDSYDGLQVAFWSLSALTVAAVVTGGVGLGLFLVGDDGAVTEP